MSTDDTDYTDGIDDFERRLRARLTDLAEHEDGWADPLPEARRRAEQGDPDDIAVVTPLPRRRRWLPGLAVAAVVLALVVGGGLGLRELARNDGADASAGSAGAAMNLPAAGQPEGDATGRSVAASTAASTAASAPTGSDVAACAAGAAATSTGPLADVATIRPSGTSVRTSSGGSVSITYQLTFARNGGNVQLRAAYGAWADDGQLCSWSGTVQPDHVEVVPVATGPGTSGTVTFIAVDSDGRSLPGGRYRAVVVIPYAVDSSGLSQLVSLPVTVTVTP